MITRNKYEGCIPEIAEALKTWWWLSEWVEEK